MNNKSSDKTAPPFNDVPLDAVRVDFSIHVHCGADTACEFVSDFEVPLGLRQGHELSTLRAIGIFFEHAVEIPMMTAARKFLEGRFRQGRKENSARTPAAPVESSLPVSNERSAFTGLTPQEAIDEFEKMFPPQNEGELPRSPSSRGVPLFTPAGPKTFIVPPVQPPGNKDLKKAA